LQTCALSSVNVIAVWLLKMTALPCVVSTRLRRVNIPIFPWRLQAQKSAEALREKTCQHRKKQFAHQCPAGLKANPIPKCSKLVHSQHWDGVHSFLKG
jgi:hypothetical protein